MFVRRANVRFSTRGDHAGMTPRTASSKLLLVADPRTVAAGPAMTPIRRFRLARLRVEGRAAAGSARTETLKRAFD
jgi:hypothetical protein